MSIKDKDLEVLALLQSDSSKTDRELSKELQISPAVFGAKRKRLASNGYIKSIKAIINHEKFDLYTTGFVLARFNQRSNRSMEDVMKAVSEEKNILEVHSTLGAFDFVIKLRAINNRELSEIVDRIAQKTNSSTETLVVSNSHKETMDVYLNTNENRSVINDDTPTS